MGEEITDEIDDAIIISDGDGGQVGEGLICW